MDEDLLEESDFINKTPDNHGKRRKFKKSTRCQYVHTADDYIHHSRNVTSYYSKLTKRPEAKPRNKPFIFIQIENIASAKSFMHNSIHIIGLFRSSHEETHLLKSLYDHDCFVYVQFLPHVSQPPEDETVSMFGHLDHGVSEGQTNVFLVKFWKTQPDAHSQLNHCMLQSQFLEPPTKKCDDSVNNTTYLDATNNETFFSASDSIFIRNDTFLETVFARH